MRAAFLSTTVALVLAVPGPTVAQTAADSGAFIVRLGTDTVAMERYVRRGDRVESIGLTRSPRTTVRRYVAMLAPDGSVARWATGTGDAQLEAAANPSAGTIPLAGQLYLPWQLMLERARAAGGTTTTVNMLVGNDIRATPVTRASPTVFEFPNQFDIPMRATVDDRGRLVSLDAGGGSTVERVAWLDIEAFARTFGARDNQGTGMGPLSPRENTSAAVGGATIAIDYSRPSLRGRALDLLVPPGQVWRTGANDATTLTTDRTLVFGNVTLAPGSYSLFALPGPEGWTLIINSQTGMSGLDRDPARDVGRVRMDTRMDASHTEQFTIEVLPRDAGGALVLRWGRVAATAPFRVGG